MIQVLQQIIVDYQQKKSISLTERDLNLTFIANMALGIVGVRRGGKSYRTHQLTAEWIKDNKSENICRIQFNDHRLVKMKSENLHVIDDAYYTLYPHKKDQEDVLFIFDEIHRISGWEDYILYLLESEKHRIVITGSTATLQRGEFASALRGKLFPSELYPFSFREFLRHYKVKEDLISSKGKNFLQHTLTRYLQQGGFPGLLDLPEERHSDLLRTYWDTMLLRDIVEAHSSERINIPFLRYFTNALIGRVGRPMTIHRLAKNIKNEGFSFNNDTLYRYLSYLADAYMIETIELFSDSEKVRARNYKKVYCVDWALADALAFGAGTDSTRALENMIYIELKRRGCAVHYFLTEEGFEVDFVASNRKKEIALIQVSYSIEDEEVKQREFRALTKTAHYLEAKTATVVTFGDEDSVIVDGIEIEVIPAWKWLLKSTGEKK